MKTCGDCEFAHVTDPRELRIRTCYGEVPQVIMMAVQKLTPDPLNPDGPPRRTMEQQLVPLRPQVAASDYACRHWAKSMRRSAELAIEGIPEK